MSNNDEYEDSHGNIIDPTDWRHIRLPDPGPIRSPTQVASDPNGLPWETKLLLRQFILQLMALGVNEDDIEDALGATGFSDFDKIDLIAG